MTTANLAPASTGVITDKGTKGLLKWIQQSMPDFYAQISPQLVAQAKGKNLQGMGCPDMTAIYSGSFADRGLSGMGAVGYYDSAASAYNTGAIGTTGSFAPITVDSTQSITPIASFDSSSVSAPSDLSVPANSTTTNAASVASSGPTSSQLATTISSLAAAVATGTVAAAQVSANNTLLQTNLARAQQGLAPLTSVTSATGLTSLTSGSGTIVLIGAVLIGALVLGGKKSS